MQTWRLQVVFEVSAVHFKADGSTSHKHSTEPELLLLQLIAVTAARSLATKSLITLLENESMCSFKCPYVGKPIASRCGNKEGHAHGLPRPINVPGFVTFSHYQIPSSRCAGILSCLKYLCLRAGGRSSNIPHKDSHKITISLCS
jgi:hypothetical protein